MNSGMSETLTMQKLLDDMRLGFTNHAPRRFGALGFSSQVIVCPYLPDEQPRKLTRRERFWVWIESLCDRAEVYYYGPKIKRTEPAPVYLIGRDLYVSPRAAAAIRISAI